MSTDRDVTGIVRSWLEEGVTALPDRVLDTVLDQLPATPQRRALWPVRRFRDMNYAAKLALVAAAVVVVAFAGFRVLAPTDTGPGGPGPSPTPTPIATGSPSPLASPLGLHPGTLTPGIYVTTPFANGDSCFTLPSPFAAPTAEGCADPKAASIRFTITVPEGWSGIETNGVWLAAGQSTAPGGAALTFIRGAWLHSNPCLTQDQIDLNGAPTDIEVGPSVDDFATAIADHPLLDATNPIEVTLDGYTGKYIDLQLPADLSACKSYFPWEPGIYAQGPSHRWHIWMLDVDGVRAGVMSSDYAGTSPENQAELEAMVDTLQIEP